MESAKCALFHPTHSPHHLFLQERRRSPVPLAPATSQIVIADRALRVGHSSRAQVVRFWRAAKYAGRAIDGQEPKYRFPAGFRKSLVLFNLHRAIATHASTVIVVESFVDTIAVHQAGYPVVGLMGSTLRGIKPIS